MDLKRIKRNFTCGVISFAMFTGQFPVHAAAVEVGMAEETAARDNVKEPGNVQDATTGPAISGAPAGDGITSAFDKQDAITLLNESKLDVSDHKVNMSVHEKGNGVMISGNCGDIEGSTFTFKDSFDFGTAGADYFIVDGLAKRKKKLDLQFYLDDEKEPFASLRLNCQNRKDYWNFSQNVCSSTQDRVIMGEHRISFKAVTDDKNDVKFLLRSVFFMKSDIPLFEFDIDESQGSIVGMNGDSSHNTECYGDVNVKVPDGYKSEYSDKKYESGRYKLDYIRGRGNSTWYSDKKPYKFKLENSTDFFGMGKNKHWILLANYYDASMLRNKFTYWLGAGIGMDYTPQCIFINVVMNNQFLGSYYLCEQVRVGKSRVDIDDLEADEASGNITTGPAITGGYLLGMSPYTENDSQGYSFRTEKGVSFVIESPGFEDHFNEAQYNYISQYVQDTENAIYGEGFKDKDGISYSDYMDIKAAADYFWVQEISHNGDAYGSSSTYLYKERNGKLYWGPLWDFDFVAWGNVDVNVEGFYNTGTPWFEMLLQDKDFTDVMADRWQVIREKLLYACRDGGQLDQYAAQLYNSQKANYNVNTIYVENFNFGDGSDVIINGAETGQSSGEPATFDSEVERLKKWISDRVDWIDKNISGIIPVLYNVKYISDGKVYKEDTYNSNSRSGLELPEKPVKDGYKFKGWYAIELVDGKETEKYYKKGSILYGDTTLYAKWIENSKAVEASGIYFAQDDFYYYSYSTLELPYYFPVYQIPFDSEAPDVTYESSNKEVAVIEKISGDLFLSTLVSGDAIITATTEDGLKAECTLHIRDTFPDGETNRDFSLEKTSAVMEIGSYERIKPVTSIEMPFTGMAYLSSDEDVAQVNEAGFIYAKKAGTALIVVSNFHVDNVLRLFKVTVTDPALKKGSRFKAGGLEYEIIKTGQQADVKCMGIVNKSAASVKIPAAVKYKDKKFKVTEVGKGAFKGCKKLKKATVGKNIKIIGAKAFYNCTSLKLLDIKSGKLKKAGKKAVGKVSGKFRIKAPAGKQKKYIKMLK